MKKYNVLVFILFLSLFKVDAQENSFGLSSGKIVMEISYPGNEMDEQSKAMLPIESTLYFKGDKTRAEVNMAMGSTIILSDNKMKTVTLLMDIMGNKIAMHVDPEDSRKEKESMGVFKVEYLGGEKKIAGFNCKQAKVTQTNKGETFSFDVWYTREIAADNSSSIGFEGIKGCMLEYEMLQNGNHMRMTTKSITEMDVKDEMFQIPDGYTFKTQEELKSNMGGGRTK